MMGTYAALTALSMSAVLSVGPNTCTLLGHVGGLGSLPMDVTAAVVTYAIVHTCTEDKSATI